MLGKNIIFLKSQGNDFGSCKLQISVIIWVFKYSKGLKLAASIKRRKVRNVLVSGWRTLALISEILTFAYCSINMVSLLYDSVPFLIFV